MAAFVPPDIASLPLKEAVHKVRTMPTIKRVLGNRSVAGHIPGDALVRLWARGIVIPKQHIKKRITNMNNQDASVDVYERLADALDALPSGFTRTPSKLEIEMIKIQSTFPLSSSL